MSISQSSFITPHSSLHDASFAYQPSSFLYIGQTSHQIEAARERAFVEKRAQDDLKNTTEKIFKKYTQFEDGYMPKSEDPVFVLEIQKNRRYEGQKHFVMRKRQVYKNIFNKTCSNCGTKDTCQWRQDRESRLLCNACSLRKKRQQEKSIQLSKEQIVCSRLKEQVCTNRKNADCIRKKNDYMFFPEENSCKDKENLSKTRQVKIDLTLDEASVHEMAQKQNAFIKPATLPATKSHLHKMHISFILNP